MTAEQNLVLKIKNAPSQELDTSLIDVDPDNPNKMSEQELDGLEAVMAKYGFAVELWVNKKSNGRYKIIDGEQRFKILIRNKIKKVQCRIFQVTEAEAAMLQQVANKLKGTHSPIKDALQYKKIFGAGKLEEFSKYIAKNMESFQKILQDKFDIKFDNIQDAGFQMPESTDIKKGEMFQLGKHRILCGDSTDIRNVKKLFDDKKSKLIFTSPPYLDLRDYEGEPNLDPEQLATAIPTYLHYSDFQCYVIGLKRKNFAVVPFWDHYTKKAIASGLKLLAWNVWEKASAGSMSNQIAMFGITHEWIFVFGKEPMVLNKTRVNKNAGDESPTSWRKSSGVIAKPGYNYKVGEVGKMYSVIHVTQELRHNVTKIHPAPFPVNLPKEYILAMTQKDDIVCDPFAGSGSTLIAAEQTGRIFYGMDIEPLYVQGLISRWEKSTGNKPKKI